MSTTIKRIALVAVAALGFGVLSVVPSQAAVQDLTVTVNSNGNPTLTSQDTRTAAYVTVGGLLEATTDTISVTVIEKSIPVGASGQIVLLGYDTITTTATRISDDTSYSALSRYDSVTTTTGYMVMSIAAGSAFVGAKFSVQFESLTATDPGVYTYSVAVRPFSAAGAGTPVFRDVTLTIAEAAVPAVEAPVAANAKAVIEAGNPGSVTTLIDSVTAGSLVVAPTVPVGKILVSNFDADDTATADTMTATITGPGYLKNSSNVGRSLIVANANTATFEVYADGTAGEAKITITTVAGASFVKTVTFFDTKPSKAVATVAKAYPKAGGTTVEAIAVVVTDASGNAIVGSAAAVTAAPTDTATTVGGASQTCTWDATDKAYWCSVAGKAADKFGPVPYTITATGTDTAKTKVTTTATVTFADNVATKAVLAGPATGTPGETVEYTLTLTEKNGYPVADMIYGVGNAPGGVLFSATAADRVVSGWTTAPFSASDSFTSLSGVITSKGVLPIAGVATGSWTLVGDGIQTLSTDAIDKTIGKTKLTVSTDVANPGVDAATDAANEATDAANAATDAALAAAEAADAATTAAQEASDAVAALSESVTKLIAGLQAQIKSLAAVVAKIAKKVKA